MPFVRIFATENAKFERFCIFSTGKFAYINFFVYFCTRFCELREVGEIPTLSRNRDIGTLSEGKMLIKSGRSRKMNIDV